MAGITPPGGGRLEPAGAGGVFVLPVEELNKYALPWVIDDRPVRALAPHPDRDDLVYLTIEHPEVLAFLQTPITEIE